MHYSCKVLSLGHMYTIWLNDDLISLIAKFYPKVGNMIICDQLLLVVCNLSYVIGNSSKCHLQLNILILRQEK
jgi:hypothetical protein